MSRLAPKTDSDSRQQLKKTPQATIPPLTGIKMAAPKGFFLTEALLQVSKEELAEFVELENLIEFGENETTQAFRMLKKKHELHTTTSEIEEKKKNVIEKMKMFESKKEAFELKQCEMAAQVKNFEKFVSENDEKGKRVARQVKAERSILEEQTQQIAHLIKELESKEDNKLNIVQQVDRLTEYTKFAEFFNEDIEGGDSSSFHNIEDVFNRSKTLLATNKSLHSSSGRIISEIERLRSQMQDLLTASNTEHALLVQKSQALQRFLNSLKATLKDDHHVIEGKKEACQNRNMEKGKLILAIGYVTWWCGSFVIFL